MDNVDIVIRVLTAIFVGGLIGFEREQKKKPAGFITHTLVCVGACVIATIQMLLVEKGFQIATNTPELMPTIRSDMGRLTAQVVSGIGFLGAGTIIQSKDKVIGITTAATLWLVACLGIAVGMGYYFLVFTVLVSVSFILIIMKRIEVYYVERKKIRRLKISFKGKEDTERLIIQYLKSKNIKVHRIKYLKEKYTNGMIEVKSIYTVLIPKSMITKDIVGEIGLYEEVTEVLSL